MEVLNATPKATFYLNELVAELSDFIIKNKYEYTNHTIWEDDGEGGSKYTEEIQDDFNVIYDQLESFLLRIKLK